MSFEGKVCWITGGSSGLGAAMARDLAGRGAHIVLSGRNRARLDQVAADCGDALVLPFDVRDDVALTDAVEQAWRWKDGVDLAIANAGVSQRCRALDSDMSVYRDVIAIDLIAQIAFAQALIRPMAERNRGALAFIGSLSSKVGVPLRTAYCAAKFGLAGYADALRSELSQTGVKVHVAYPGPIKTNISLNALSGDGSQRGRSDSDIEGGLEPDDAARQIIGAIADGQREIIIGQGPQFALCEARRTPDAIFDQVAALVASGYMEQMEGA